MNMWDISNYVLRRYREFIQKKGYIPIRFSPYSKQEVFETHPTITTGTGNNLGGLWNNSDNGGCGGQD